INRAVNPDRENAVWDERNQSGVGRSCLFDTHAMVLVVGPDNRNMDDGNDCNETVHGASAPLTLAATPIGNLADLTDRAKRVLGPAGSVAAVDTRPWRELWRAQRVKTTPTVVSHPAQNETDSAQGLSDAIRAGQHVVPVREAGMPAISDPGYRLT